MGITLPLLMLPPAQNVITLVGNAQMVQLVPTVTRQVLSDSSYLLFVPAKTVIIQTVLTNCAFVAIILV